MRLLLQVNLVPVVVDFLLTKLTFFIPSFWFNTGEGIFLRQNSDIKIIFSCQLLIINNTTLIFYLISKINLKNFCYQELPILEKSIKPRRLRHLL